MSRVCFLLALLSIALTAECHLIRVASPEDVTTKEVLLPHENEVEVASNAVDAPVDEVIEETATKEVLLPHENEVEVASNAVDAPVAVDEVMEETDTQNKIFEASLDRKCAAIGESCLNHKDCCSNSCLGYMKKCVS